LKLNQVQL